MTTSTIPRVRLALLGTGRMGAPIARNLLEAGLPVTVWNRNLGRAAALAGSGASLASTPAQAAQRAEVVLTMLADGAATEQVMGGQGGALESMPPGAVWVQMATIGLDWTERLALRAAEQGVEFVDAPVSGSDGQARDGELVVLASGPQELRVVLRPIFEAVGRKTRWLGPAGQGTRLKLVLNNWLAAQVEALAETVALAEALGVRAHLVPDTLADSPLGSPFAVAKAQAMVDGQFTAGFALRLAFKDVGLALEAAQKRRVMLPFANALESRWQEAITEGHGNEDLSVVITQARKSPAWRRANGHPGNGSEAISLAEINPSRR